MSDLGKPSNEQKRYVAAVCPEFKSRVELKMENETVENEISCDECIHWDDARCDIFDEILTSIDQT